MPVLVITNNTTSPSAISDPATSFSEDLPASTTSTFDVSQKTLDNLKPQLDDLGSREDANGVAEFTIDVQSDTEDGDAEYGGVAALMRWAGNRAVTGVVADDPTTGSTVAIRRINLSAGDVVADGVHFAYAGATDVVGDAEILPDGTDVSAVDLVVNEDVYTHFLMVNNAATLEILLVRGVAAANGAAQPLSDAQLAEAVGNYLSLPAPYSNFIHLAEVLFSESTGITQTTGVVNPVPAGYA